MSYKSTSDESLMARIGQQDRVAFAVLCERHIGRYLGYATKFLADENLAQDVMQEAFVRVWRYASRWDPAKNTKFTTWFYRVVTNLCLDVKRKEKKLYALEDANNIASDEQGADMKMQNKERSEQLMKALEQLPLRQKKAIMLCYIQELSNKETAEILEVTVSAVEALLVRARRTLNSILLPEKEELLKEIGGK